MSERIAAVAALASVLLVGVPLAAASDKPANPPAPVKAARTFLKRLEGTRGSLAAHADFERGLVYIDHTPDAGQDQPPPNFEKRLCGKALRDALPEIEKRMVRKLKDGERDPNPPTCKTVGPDAECAFGPLAEYSATMRVRFRALSAEQIVVSAVALFDENLVPPEQLAPEFTDLDRRLARAKAAPCPPAGR